MSKISYILATNRPLLVAADALKSVLYLPEHDKEIIVCCPNKDENDEYIKTLNANIRIVEDKVCTGSVSAFNQAYLATDGDYVSLLIDDIAYPSNFLDIVKFMESDFIQKKRFKLANILWDGGPGLHTYGHDSAENGSFWPIDMNSIVPPNLCPYSILPLPFFSREVIVKELGNHIFNPKFEHHYCDHWLGFYCTHNETFEPNKWRCPTVQYQKLENSRTLKQHDEHDSEVLRELATSFAKGVSSYV